MVSLRKEKTEKYTYEDYKTWNDDVRREIIDGHVYNMAAPSQRHQRVLGEIFVKFHVHLKGKSCDVFMAPSDVRLNFDTSDDTVVQPDMFVVCDKNKLDGQNCNGAPDIVLEILSPSTSTKDKFKKFNAYLNASVAEYWVVDPAEKIITVYTLSEEGYTAKNYGVRPPKPTNENEVAEWEIDMKDWKEEWEIIKVTRLGELEIDLNEIFESL